MVADDYNFDVNEPKKYYQEQLTIGICIWRPESTKRANADSRDIFKNAEFWLSKGLLIQSNQGNTGGGDSDHVALDYYLSGVKIDPTHFGCIYNVGCCHFFTKKFSNALKWFDLAIRADRGSLDAHYGRAAACLKLGCYTEALKSVALIDRAEWSGHFDAESELCSESRCGYRWH